MPEYVFNGPDGYIVIAGWKVYIGTADSVDVWPVRSWWFSSTTYTVRCEAGSLVFPKPGCSSASRLCKGQQCTTLRKVRRGSTEEKQVVRLLTQREGVELPGTRRQPGGTAIRALATSRSGASTGGLDQA